MLETRGIEVLQALSGKARKGFEGGRKRLLDAGVIKRQVIMPARREAERVLTLQWLQTPPFSGTPRRAVRCGLPFATQLDETPPRRCMAAAQWMCCIAFCLSVCLKRGKCCWGVLPHAGCIREMIA